MKKWMIAVVAVVVVAVGAGCFFGGRAAAGSGTPTVEEAMRALQDQFQDGGANGSNLDNGAPNGFPGADGTARRGGAVSGSIIAADQSSITVKTTDGSSKIVLLSSGTVVNKVSDGVLADLVTGQEVVVTGTTNSDGTVTATRVQLGATFVTNGGQGGPMPGDGSMPPGGPTGGAAGSMAPNAGSPSN
jgi:hypothetical protein